MSGSDAALRPVRSVRTENQLGSLAADSIVCGTHDPGHVFQAGGNGDWFEPRSEEPFTTAALWEFLTGAYETIIVDEDREG
ncbi:hypothetical protein [Sinomonas gamaensis]|uniref:hypothetical protein n=1 Tax=Sinomonas gamaensis TaxID=2565624 RepID=UPI001108C51E|nr:hypothetical protein [Sinomonas gamaensis]